MTELSQSAANSISQEEENHLNENSGDTEQEHVSMYSNRYATIKTVAEGSLDLALMSANITIMKVAINHGEDFKYYYALVVIIPVVLLLQIAVGILLCILGFTNSKNQKTKQRAETLNITSVSLLVVITILSVVVSSLGTSD